MLKFVIASCIAATVCGQIDSKEAKILKEQRFNAGDGRFGSAFAQEDGTVYREETTADGERIGQYSYIDDLGNQITVKYTAGKDGFRILEGAHVPTGATGQSSAPLVANSDPVAVPAPVAQPGPLAQSAFVVKAAVPQQSFDYDDYEYDSVQITVDPNTNPFINLRDPTLQNFQHNANEVNFVLEDQRFSAPGVSFVPNCANCAGVNPFINPFDASHQSPQQFIPRAPVQQHFQTAPTFSLHSATKAPKRLFPPGQLKLNRFETGFNFDFNSQ